MTERQYHGLNEAVIDVLVRYREPVFSDLVSEVARQLGMAVTPALVVRIRQSGACDIEGEGVRFGPGAVRQRSRRLAATREFLRQHGPAHFSDIAEGIADELADVGPPTPRNVHAWLDRHKEQFVWAGPGTYRLRESGEAENESEDLPNRYLPTRRRGIGDDIVRLLLERQPRSLAEIESHIVPRFAVNRASVNASIVNDRAARFVMTRGRQVFLRDADIAAFEAERPRVAGLIDWDEVAAQLADFGCYKDAPGGAKSDE